MLRVYFMALGFGVSCIACTSGKSEQPTFECGDAGLVCQTATEACIVEKTTGGTLDGATIVSTFCEAFGECRSCDCMGLPDSGDSCDLETCAEVNGGVTLHAHLCQ